MSGDLTMGGEAKEHVFELYTLAMHRGGLYLIGRSYPQAYSPERHIGAAFGIIADERLVDVELLVMDEATARYIRARRVHPSQRLRERPDGKLVMSMLVKGTPELRNWVLGFGPHLQVLAPPELRESVRAELATGLALYEPAAPRRGCGARNP